MALTSIVLDRRGRDPLHRQVYRQWRQGILEGRFAPGARMPSTRDLAATLAVSRATVTLAYEQLAAEGYIEGRHGSGTFVSAVLPDRGFVSARARRAPPVGPPLRPARVLTRLARVAPVPATPAGTIDLSGSGPDHRLFPFAVWARLVRRHLRGLGPEVFRYARGGAGYEALRVAIASYLREARAVRCDPAEVIVVSGSQQALDLCTRVLVDPGDVVAVEEPGYPGARQLFAAARARVHYTPVDDDGLVVGALPPAARVVYVTPSHQFPLGMSLSLARRLELVAWAQARHTVVIEDDYDSEFRYSGAPLPALQGLGDRSRIVYVGTFSNAMFPGLRLGYVVPPPALVEYFTRAKWYADRQSASLEQAALADFIAEGHFAQHVRRMRRTYGMRRQALVAALEVAFGPRVRVRGDAAGLHMVVQFDGAGVVRGAGRRGVEVRSTAEYYAGRPPDGECILRFADLGERTIREAVRRLAGGS